VEDLAALAAAGDELAASLVREAGGYIGLAAAGVINLLSPDYILVGGPLAAAGELLLGAIREEAERRALAAPFSEVQFGFGALGAAAAPVGAAALVLRETPRLLARARVLG
jgi:predicted NBD/HSP70 family sugar kinase